MDELTGWAMLASMVCALIVRFRREAGQLERLQRRNRAERNRFERGLR